MDTKTILVGKNGERRSIAQILQTLREKNEAGLLHIPYVNGRPVLAVAKDAAWAKGQLSFIGYKVIYPFLVSKFSIEEDFAKQVAKFLSEQLSTTAHQSKSAMSETARIKADIAGLLETIANPKSTKKVILAGLAEAICNLRHGE